jgi:dienelactone hydrolase
VWRAPLWPRRPARVDSLFDFAGGTDWAVSIEMLVEAMLSGELQGCLVKPEVPNGWGIIVLAGSNGRTDVARARLFAETGFTALALRWFGGEGQTPGICEIPLEIFLSATSRLLQEGAERLAYIGTSKGAEAALLVATLDPRIDLVMALSPTSVVWANTGVGRDGPGWPLRSSWTYRGDPLPFVRYDLSAPIAMVDGLPSYRGYVEQSLITFGADVEAAAIHIEVAWADIILVAGSADALWPSDVFARALAKRRTDAGRPAHLLIHPRAGHRVLLPGENPTRSTQNAHGGDDLADAELGKWAWAAMRGISL